MTKVSNSERGGVRPPRPPLDLPLKTSRELSVSTCMACLYPPYGMSWSRAVSCKIERESSRTNSRGIQTCPNLLRKTVVTTCYDWSSVQTDTDLG